METHEQFAAKTGVEALPVDGNLLSNRVGENVVQVLSKLKTGSVSIDPFDSSSAPHFLAVFFLFANLSLDDNVNRGCRRPRGNALPPCGIIHNHSGRNSLRNLLSADAPFLHFEH